MANAIGDNFHADFSSLRVVEIDLFDFERRFEFVEYCSFHGTLLLWCQEPFCNTSLPRIFIEAEYASTFPSLTSSSSCASVGSVCARAVKRRRASYSTRANNSSRRRCLRL